MGKEAYKDIWVFAEQEDGVLSGTTFELLAKAHDLEAKLGGTDAVVAVLLGSGVAGLALGGYCLTFLAEDLNGGFDIAVSLGESFFAVHQAGACEVAQLGDFCHCYCHICYL